MPSPDNPAYQERVAVVAEVLRYHYRHYSSTDPDPESLYVAEEVLRALDQGLET